MDFNGYEEYKNELKAARDDPEKQEVLMIERMKLYIEQIMPHISVAPKADEAAILAALKTITKTFENSCDPMGRMMADAITQGIRVEAVSGTYSMSAYEEMMKTKK